MKDDLTIERLKSALKKGGIKYYPHAIEEVETFRKRLHDTEIIFTPKSKDDKKIILELIHTMRHFEEESDNEDNDSFRRFCAGNCLFWINYAYTSGIIQKGEGFTTITKEYEDKINRLKEELDKCNEKCKALEDKNTILNVLKDKGELEGHPP